MKLMRKLEKQALARAAKEARKQQGNLKFWSALWTRGQGCTYGGSFCCCCWSGGHFKISLIKTSKVIISPQPPRDTHAALTTFVFMYMKMYFHPTEPGLSSIVFNLEPVVLVHFLLLFFVFFVPSNMTRKNKSKHYQCVSGPFPD